MKEQFHTMFKKRIKVNFFEYKTVNINNINDLRFEDTDVLSGVEYNIQFKQMENLD